MQSESRHGLRAGIALAALITILILVSAILTDLDLDRRISALFYSTDAGWALGERQPWQFLYEYGTLPGIVLTLVCLAGWFVSLVTTRLHAWRRLFLLVILTSVIGGGILVNGVLKPYWGRPRPRQITEFGGKWDYRPMFLPGTPGKGKSFPCGHCTMGYIFLAAGFFYPRSRRLAVLGGGFGFLYGSLLGAARILQGGHFLTDVIWSFGIMLMTALILYEYVLDIPSKESDRASSWASRHRRLVTMGFTAACFLIVAAFLTRRPFYETYKFNLILPSGIRDVVILTDVDLEAEKITYQDVKSAKLWLHVNGFGWTSVDFDCNIIPQTTGQVLRLPLSIKSIGYFAEKNYRIELILPKAYENRINVEFSGDSGQ